MRFLQSFYHDKILSLVTGLPSAYEDTVDGRVTTIWPRSLAAFNAVSHYIYLQERNHKFIFTLPGCNIP